LWKALRIHFADKEVVELIVSTAWYGCAAETTGCLKIELDDTLVDVPAVPSRW
jgi:alkylhydroperoxidase family enzyme